MLAIVGLITILLVLASIMTKKIVDDVSINCNSYRCMSFFRAR